MKLSVIVPVFNKKLYISELFRRICSAPLHYAPALEKNAPKVGKIGSQIDSLELLVIDDASTDGSRELLKSLETHFPMASLCSVPCTFRLFLQGKNQGKGAAVRLGISQSQGDIVLIQDGDLDYDPGDYALLLNPILSNRADAVMGSRYLGSERRITSYRGALADRLVTSVFNLFSNKNLTDVMSCYKVMTGTLARSLRLTSNRFGIEAELCARIAKTEARFYDVGVSYNGTSPSETKKLSVWVHVAAFFQVLKFTLLGGTPYQASMNQVLNDLLEASDAFYVKPLRKWFKELGIKNRNLRILEIGSGIGAITRELLNYGSVVATDIDPESIKHLKDRYDFVDDFSAVRWDACASVTDPATPPQVALGKFDLVIAINVVEHLPDANLAVKNWSTLLNPGGKIIILVPFSQKLYSPFDKAIGHYMRYSKGQLHDLFESTGGRVLKSSFLNPLGIVGWYINGIILQRSDFPSGQAKLYRYVKPLVMPIEFVLEKFVGLSVVGVGQWKNPEAS